MRGGAESGVGRGSPAREQSAIALKQTQQFRHPSAIARWFALLSCSSSLSDRISFRQNNRVYSATLI
jgi:hypothetical protein